MGKILKGSLALFMGVYLFCQPAHSVARFYLDYDGTIWHPKTVNKSILGAYGTKIRLYKIRNRPNLLVSVPEGPEIVEVTGSDIRHRLTRINEVTELEESLLSPQDGRIGSLEKVTLSDGTVIIPGLYRIVNPDSFLNYRESPAGKNYLLDDFKKSEELEAKKIGTFRGPYWSHMVNMLSNAETAKQFGIITARGHSQREWGEFFKYLKERGYIQFTPDLSNIHNINRSEYEKFGVGDDDSVRKVELLRQIALELGQKKIIDSDLRLHPNGKKAGSFHVLAFVDDNQKTLELAHDVLRDLAMRRFQLKIIISNSGEDHEIKKSRRPRSYVITADGVLRPSTAYEAYGEPVHQSEVRFDVAGMLACSSLFN